MIAPRYRYSNIDGCSRTQSVSFKARRRRHHQGGRLMQLSFAAMQTIKAKSKVEIIRWYNHRRWQRNVAAVFTCWPNMTQKQWLTAARVTGHASTSIAKSSLGASPKPPVRELARRFISDRRYLKWLLIKNMQNGREKVHWQRWLSVAVMFCLLTCSGKASNPSYQEYNNKEDQTHEKHRNQCHSYVASAKT